MLPLGRVGEQLECQGCFSRFSPEVLTGGTSDEVLTAILVGEPAPSQPGSAPWQQELPKASSLAITSLILGLLSPVFLCACGLSLLTSPVAIITGHVALANIKRSAGRLAGRSQAVAGLVLGYLLLVVSIAGWALFAPSFYGGWQNAQQRASQPRSPARASAEEQLWSAEICVLTSSTEGVASGNSPAAKDLAAAYAEVLKTMRDALFTKDRERLFSLTDGQFVVHCELHPGRCLFLVPVPAYRDFDKEAKGSLEVSAWQLAQQAVEERLDPDDRLADGLRGTALYGAVLVGPAGSEAADSRNYTRADRRELLAFFPAAGDVPAAASLEGPDPSTQPADGAALDGPVPDEAFAVPAPAGRGDSPDSPGPPPSAPDAASDPPTASRKTAGRSSSTTAQNGEASSRAAPPRPRAEAASTTMEIGRRADVAQQFPDLGWTVQSLAFAPNGRFLAAGKLDATLLLLDVSTGQRLHSEPRRNELGQIQCVAFSNDGSKLLAGGYRGTIQVWNVDEAGRLQAAGSIRGHARPVTSLVTSPAGPLVLSGSAAGDLIWQTPASTWAASSTSRRWP
jgi:hypothetical protein